MALPVIEAVITADTRGAEAGFDRVERGLAGVGSAADRAAARTSTFDRQLQRGTGSGAFTRNIQNASFQLGDFAVQVGAGTSASVALSQQLPQLLGGFGALGAVLGAVVAIGIPLTRLFTGMAEQGRDMTTVFGTLQPVMQSIGEAFSTVASLGMQFAELIINNLDRIIITAGVAAAAFAGPMVASFIAARVAAMTFAGSLAFVRAAIIRTGIGALVIGAGELIYQFSRLVSAAGGFGEALGMLGGVAVAVWGGIVQSANGMWISLSGVAQGIAGEFINAFADIVDAWNSMVSAITDNIPESMFALPAIGPALAATKYGLGAARADGISDSLRGTATGLISEGLTNREGGSGMVATSMDDAIDRVKNIRDLLAGMKEDRITLPDILGAGSEDDEGAGKGASKAKDAIDEQIESLKYLKQQGRDTWSALGDFIQQFSGKSKAAAIAAIAIQKGLSIAQIIANTAAAQMRALAELGPIAGPPVAAKIGLLGKVQAGLVAATGLGQAMGAGGSAGSSGSSGGGRGGGSGAAAASSVSTLDVNLTVQGRGDLATSPGAIDSLTDMLLKNFKDRGLDVVRVTA